MILYSKYKGACGNDLNVTGRWHQTDNLDSDTIGVAARRVDAQNCPGPPEASKRP